jgi:RNA polymerase sigma-70 factor (ECF subfamily)
MRPIRGVSDAAMIRASYLDPPSFEVVFDRHWAKVHRYCVTCVGPPGVDLAAETFDVAFDHRRRYDGRDDAAPWLLGIARNLVRERFRRSAPADRGLRRLGPEVPLDPRHGQLDRIEADRLGRALARVLERLSPSERDTLLLHVCSGLGEGDLARATAVPVMTVRSRMHRARRHVRAQLGFRNGPSIAADVDRADRADRADLDWIAAALPDAPAPDGASTERAHAALRGRLSAVPPLVVADRLGAGAAAGRA